ncbi:MAG: tyrosine--tRNA ligase [Candidatus Aenigmatarchaeota archaeon]|nr:MAG: tyrosine--tRNA ligase [Candidatus Aenigmarchaeota archaeon]
MDMEKRMELIKQVGEEILTEEELRELLAKKRDPIAYDGFEPSGRMHIAQGILRAININKMTRAGCKFKMLVADWHAWANNKMGGDLDAIQMVGEYMIEVWRASGMELDNVEFVWASDLAKDDEYWKIVMNVARASTLNRIIRTAQIMGRSERDTLSAAQILYPCMQAADIFYLKADITQLGMDQRKVNVLARELGPSLGFWKPVVVSHHMLMGLVEPTTKPHIATRHLDLQGTLPLPNGGQLRIKSVPSQKGLLPVLNHPAYGGRGFSAKFFYTPPKSVTATEEELWQRELTNLDGIGVKLISLDQMTGEAQLEIISGPSAEERAMAMKMSKSVPDSAIFMTDSVDDISEKISKAYCPEKQTNENPILEYCRHIIFGLNEEMKISRSAKWGGNVTYSSYGELERDYAGGKLHPMDLKAAVIKYLVKAVEPIQKHFSKNKKAAELLKFVEGAKVTR